MKKIITSVSAMTLSFQSGAVDHREEMVVVSDQDMEIMYDNEAVFNGSGFIDLKVEKTVLWSRDVDGSGDISLGDELKYTVKVINLDSVPADDVVLFDLLESKIELNLGTVAVTQGLVVSGNNFVDPLNYVDVYLGDIAPNWFALVDFDVTITSLSPGINSIINSAEVYGPSGSFFLSDDPTTPLFDPTQIRANGAYPDMIFRSDFETTVSGGF